MPATPECRHAAFWQSLVHLRDDRDPGDEDDHEIKVRVGLFAAAFSTGMERAIAAERRELAVIPAGYF